MSDPVICLACMTWHPLPKCSHDATAPCFDCHKPRGWRWIADGGNAAAPAWRCWFCAFGMVRPEAVVVAAGIARSDADALAIMDGRKIWEGAA